MEECLARPQRPSFWQYFVAQITAKQLDSPQIIKHERVYNFLHVPEKLEGVHLVGIEALQVKLLVAVDRISCVLGCLPLQPYNFATANPSLALITWLHCDMVGSTRSLFTFTVVFLSIARQRGCLALISQTC